MSADVRTSEWDSLILSKKLVAADFWAEWCPYCVRLKPIFESAAKDYQDIKFVKVNVQAEADIASRYGIQGIPVIKFFCEGKEVGEIVGFVPENVLKNRVEEISKNAPSCLSNTSIRR
jgi:thioredoxin 1